MIGRPLQNKRHGTAGQHPAQHAEISQVEDRLMFSIKRMEMRGLCSRQNI